MEHLNNQQILFICRLRDLVLLYHRSTHAVDPMRSEHELRIHRAIWDEFFHEPSKPLDVNVLLTMSDPYFYLVHGLYSHLSMHNMRPQQDAMLDDESGIVAINNYLVEAVFSRSFTNKMEMEARAVRKRRSSIESYLMAKQMAYRRLLIVRLDLGYRRSIGLSEQTLSAAWAELLRYVRKQYPSHVGYAVKFEYGSFKGMHAHCIFLFDANKVINDAKIARIIGEHWQERVTNGMGVYYNGNTEQNKQRMRYPVIGLVQEPDEIFLQGVRKLASYLAKADPMVHFYLPARARIFRRGSVTSAEKRRIAKYQSRQNMQQVA